MRNLVLATVLACMLTGCGKNKEGELAEVVNVADAGLEPQLLKGFHPVEQGWRWSMSQFSVALKPPKHADKGAVLLLKYSLPDAVLEKQKEVSLTASINGIPLPAEKCTKGGLQEMRREVPGDIFKGKTAITADFTIAPFLAPSDTDKRELGVIVHTVGLLKK
ncbi:MAG: hypothetical protein HY820_43665 [Acidobacteria bacterium]|nr:hypothetical protein [Acidobacteriota bacterium]